MRYFLFILFILSPILSFVYAQINLDSLQKAYHLTKEDTIKFTLAKELRSEFYESFTEKAFHYNHQMIEIAIKLNDNQRLAYAYAKMGDLYRGIVNDTAVLYYDSSIICYNNHKDFDAAMKVLNRKCGVYKRIGDYESAWPCYGDLEKMSIEHNNDYYLGSTYTRFADLYRYAGDYPNATNFYLKAISIFEKGGYKDDMAGSLNNLAVTYSLQGNNDKSREIQFKNLQILEEIGDSVSMVLSLNNIGSDLWEFGKREDALEIYERAKQIIDELGEERVGYKYVSGYNSNMAYVEMDLKHYNKAREYLLKALKLKEGANSTKGISTICGDLALLEILTGNYTMARHYINRKLKLSEEMAYPNGVMESYQLFSELYSTSGSYKLAFEYLEKYLVLILQNQEL